MKKIIKIMVVSLALILVFGSLSVFAEGEEKIVIDNDRFYVEMPQGFTEDTVTTENYYFTDENYTEVEFYVTGNLQFPKGIGAESEDVIGKRALRIMETTRSDISVSDVKKCRINGFAAACVTGEYNWLITEYFKAYVFATKETVYIVYAQASTQKDLIALDAVIVNFTINGTYFPGDEPTIKHDFSKSQDYYTAFEKNSEGYYIEDKEFNEFMNKFIGVFFAIILASPIIFVLLIVFIVKSRKYKKISEEYESYFGPILAVRNQFKMQQMYNYGGNPYVPQMMNNPAQGYPQPIQPIQPVQPQEQVINQPQENNIEQ